MHNSKGSLAKLALGAHTLGPAVLSQGWAWLLSIKSQFLTVIGIDKVPGHTSARAPAACEEP